MTRNAHIVGLWRHPIKAHGRESLDCAHVDIGGALPWDRVWAVAHDAAKLDGARWVPCPNFSRGAKAPKLMAMTCALDETTEIVTFTHPDLGTLRAHPEQDTAAILAWLRPIMPENRAASVAIMRGERAMTDSKSHEISLINAASNRALGAELGADLSMHRWRGNIHVDGLAPWAEMDMVGRRIRLGEAEFDVIKPITRCRATTVNPETGARDLDTLGALNRAYNHQFFGVGLRVVSAGRIAVHDTLEVL